MDARVKTLIYTVCLESTPNMNILFSSSSSSATSSSLSLPLLQPQLISTSPTPTKTPTTTITKQLGFAQNGSRRRKVLAMARKKQMIQGMPRPGESKGFAEEMRFVAMKLHTQFQQVDDDDGDEDESPFSRSRSPWKPSISGYLKFLVDSKLVFDTIEEILSISDSPSFVHFRNTGLERAKRLAEDLKWLNECGHVIPEPSPAGKLYSEYLANIGEENPKAFLCHVYNIYFTHIAGSLEIGKQVSNKILDGRELEFYKWTGSLPDMLKLLKVNLNKIAEDWSREDKDIGLQEATKSFEYSEKILRLIIG